MGPKGDGAPILAAAEQRRGTAGVAAPLEVGSPGQGDIVGTAAELGVIAVAWTKNNLVGG